MQCSQASENSRGRNGIQPRAWGEMVKVVLGAFSQGFCKTRKGKEGAVQQRWHDINWGWYMIHSWVTMWWGLNADKGWHPTLSSWLAFSLWKAVVRKGSVSVITWLAFGYSQRPVVLTLAFNYGTNTQSTKWSQCLLTLEPLEFFSDLLLGKEYHQDEQERKSGSLWGTWLIGEVFINSFPIHVTLSILILLLCHFLIYFFNFTLL